MSADEEMEDVVQNIAALNLEGNQAQEMAVHGLPMNEENDKIEAFLLAAHRGCLEDVLRFLKEGVDVGADTGDGETALTVAAEEGHLEVVKALLAAGSPLFHAAQPDTPLHVAACAGHTEVVAVLLDAGAPLGPRGWPNKTPLHYAAWYGHVACLELLLAAGADIHAFDTWHGSTPLHDAVEESRIDCINALLRGGANINARTISLETPLHLALDPKIILLLARAGANLNCRDRDGDTALHHQADYGPIECVRLLLSVGANPTIRNNVGKRPIDVATDLHKRTLLLNAMRSKGCP